MRQWFFLKSSQPYKVYFNKKLRNNNMLSLVSQLCPTLCDTEDCSPPDSFVHGNSPGKNTGVDCHAFLQGIFPAQGLSPGLPRCRRILYLLSQVQVIQNKKQLPDFSALESIWRYDFQLALILNPPWLLGIFQNLKPILAVVTNQTKTERF